MHKLIAEDICRLLDEREDLERLRDKSILISGANSFLMSYFVLALLENNRRNHAGTQILALCRSRERAEARFGPCLEDPNFKLILQDVREPVTWNGKADICVHAASPAGIRSRQEHPLDTFQINMWGCQNLLNFSLEKESERFLLLSSVDVYGNGLGQARRRESDVGLLDWTYRRNAYSSGKRGAETLCSLYHEQFHLPCVTARPFQVYGPGMSLTDGRLHGDFIRQLLRENRIVLKSDGSAVRSFMYLLDATHALLDALFYGEAGECYNICDEKSECSVRELAELYAAQWGNGSEIVFDRSLRNTPEVKEALSVVTGDGSRLRGLGWRSRTSLEAGIRRTLEYYSEKGR